MNDIVDYYQVLGIPADADLNTIKAAFRRLAMQYHPDRGGSHEKMLEINEAFQVLANPASRADYDRWRADMQNAEAQLAAQNAMSAAAQASASYPSRSDQIDPWMDALTKDFLAASYGRDESGMWPTIENSTSGAGFLLVGAAIGGLLAYWLFFETSVAGLHFIAAGAAGGAFLGQFLHKSIGESLKSSSTRAAQAVSGGTSVVMTSITGCPRCGQQLRFTSTPGVTLRCPKCQEAFSPA